jgi:hypothetical protein
MGWLDFFRFWMATPILQIFQEMRKRTRRLKNFASEFQLLFCIKNHDPNEKSESLEIGLGACTEALLHATYKRAVLTLFELTLDDALCVYFFICYSFSCFQSM